MEAWTYGMRNGQAGDELEMNGWIWTVDMDRTAMSKWREIHSMRIGITTRSRRGGDGIEAGWRWSQDEGHIQVRKEKG